MTRLLRPRFVALALALALALGVLPAGAEASMVGSLPAGSRDLTPRQAREARVLRLLAEARVADALRSVGLTAQQVRARLDRLDDQQLDELAQRLETIQSGQGGAYFLVGVAVALLLVVVYMMIEAA